MAQRDYIHYSERLINLIGDMVTEITRIVYDKGGKYTFEGDEQMRTPKLTIYDYEEEMTSLRINEYDELVITGSDGKEWGEEDILNEVSVLSLINFYEDLFYEIYED
jgi:hypothetical protein